MLWENQALVPTNMPETEKVSPKAVLVLKTCHKSCGHTTKEEVDVPAEMVNQEEKEIQALYPQWKVIGFSPEEVVLYREVNGICDEHYAVRAKDGLVAVYVKNEKGEEALKELTGISMEYLPEEDQKKIQAGIEITGKEQLNSLLEDYE